MKKFIKILYLSIFLLPQIFVNYHPTHNLKINSYSYKKQNNTLDKKSIQLNSSIQVIKDSKKVKQVSNDNLNSNLLNAFQISMLGFILGSLLFGFVASITVEAINKFWRICSLNKSTDFNNLQINSLDSTPLKPTTDFNVETYEHIHENEENMSSFHSAINTSTEIQVVNNDNNEKNEVEKTDVEAIHPISENSNRKTQHTITNSITTTLEGEHSSNNSETKTSKSNEIKRDCESFLLTQSNDEGDNYKSEIERLNARLLYLERNIEELNSEHINTLQKLDLLHLEIDENISKRTEINQKLTRLNELYSEAENNRRLYKRIWIFQQLYHRYDIYGQMNIDDLDEEWENQEVQNLFDKITNHAYSNDYFIGLFGLHYRQEFLRFFHTIRKSNSSRESIHPINNELNPDINSWIINIKHGEEWNIKNKCWLLTIEMCNLINYGAQVEPYNIIDNYRGIHYDIRETLRTELIKIDKHLSKLSKEKLETGSIASKIISEILSLQEEISNINEII